MRKVTALIITAMLASTATPAFAGTGCNGVINPLVWGCAPWDNNNGPQFPYYVDRKKNQITIPQKQAQTRIVGGRTQVLHNGAWLQVSGTNGPNLVASGILSQNGVN